MLLVLTGAVALVLLISCANVAVRRAGHEPLSRGCDSFGARRGALANHPPATDRKRRTSLAVAPLDFWRACSACAALSIGLIDLPRLTGTMPSSASIGAS